ncbi:hypothetical protein [Hyphomicrobium sp.]|uniref:hypothetical protein n=1 Tax=Hyphomicrobium sp. TaxID=82 RepID=UPI00356A3FFE
MSLQIENATATLAGPGARNIADAFKGVRGFEHRATNDVVEDNGCSLMAPQMCLHPEVGTASNLIIANPHHRPPIPGFAARAATTRELTS